MRFLRNNGLTIVLVLLFLGAFVGQILAGFATTTRSAASTASGPSRSPST